MKKSDLVLCWVETQKEVIRLKKELESTKFDRDFWFNRYKEIKEKCEPEEKTDE